jgi:hypothetical protein
VVLKNIYFTSNSNTDKHFALAEPAYRAVCNSNEVFSLPLSIEIIHKGLAVRDLALLKVSILTSSNVSISLSHSVHYKLLVVNDKMFAGILWIFLLCLLHRTSSTKVLSVYTSVCFCHEILFSLKLELEFIYIS